MKTIVKKLSLSILVVILFSSYTFAQLGVKGGVSFANQKWTVSGTSVTLDSKLGFHFGLINDMLLSGSFYIEPGVFFAQKGFKLSSSDSNGQGEVTLTLNYIDVPVIFIYKINAGNNLKINLATGPVFCYGIGGTGKSSLGSGDIQFGSGADDDYKPLDIDMSIGGGIEFSNIQFCVAYNIGLSNISNVDGITMKNNVLNLSLAVLFGKKK
jgi:hypothetical protein